MTRFARAKGAKASNERVVEDATSWTEMKQQLLNKKKETIENEKRKVALDQRNKNYQMFLEGKESVEFNNTSWSDFSKCSDPKQKDKGEAKYISSDLNTYQSNNNDSDAPPEEESAKEQIARPSITVKRPKSTKALSISVIKKGVDNKNSNQVNLNKKPKVGKHSSKTIENDSKDDGFDKRTSTVVKESLTEKDIKKIEKKKQKRLKQLLKKKTQLKLKRAEKVENLPETIPDKVNAKYSTSKDTSLISENKKPKKDKLENSTKQHARKKPLTNTMFINGKQVEICYFDGFPIKKEDGEHLKTLKKQMISKGLPRSEINIALKLERRKAEKSFAREKKKVCFNCRQSGHNLSQCPNIDKHNSAQAITSAICFKCGSTEHTHFECKVVRGQDYKFATCFICKEPGHIARQCPDNARGLYPKGGACNVCGDVTHLKRDCPKHHAQQQRRSEDITIEAIEQSNPDVMDTEERDKNSDGISYNKPNKIIKF